MRLDCRVRTLCYDTMRYDTRCYFDVRSKADMSQLNLPHWNNIYKKLSYRRGTARRAVSVKTVLNVAQMFVDLHVIGLNPAIGLL